MKLVKALPMVACFFLAAGCATHETKFERDVPPPPSRASAESANAATEASRLIQRHLAIAISLPTESLAAFAQAAALLFETTSAPGMKAAAQRFADTLLEGRIRVATGWAFFGSQGNPNLEATTDAGNALIEVYRITKDERYHKAVRDAALAVRSMGWRATKDGFAVRVRRTRRLYNVALTAQVALFLERANRSDAASNQSVRQATSAFHFIAAHQAAVGRWYWNVGSKTPMTLEPWARTLLALASSSAGKNQGIVGGGVSGLWSAAFTETGAPRHGPLVDERGIGVALSLRLLQRFSGSDREANLAYDWIIAHRRDDGTVEEARSDDTLGQSYYALAFAERTLALSRPEAWSLRLS